MSVHERTKPAHTAHTAHTARPYQRRQWGAVRLLFAVLLLTGLWAVALWNLRSVLEPGPWLWSALAMGGSALLVGWVIRLVWPQARASASLVGSATALVYWLFHTGLSGRLRLWWDDFPGMTLVLQEQIYDEFTPLAVNGPIEDMALLLIALGCIVSTLTLIGLDSPLVAAIVPSLILLIPVAATGVSVGPEPFIAAGVVIGLLTWLRSSSFTWVGAVAALSAVALAVGVVAALPQTRDKIWNDVVVPGPVDPRVPNVALSLAEDIGERSDVPVFRYVDPVGGPMRFTLATLTDFEVGQWLPDDSTSDTPTPMNEPRLESTPPTALPAVELDGDPRRTLAISVDGLVSAWLPLPHSSIQQVAPAPESDADFDRWEWTDNANTAESTGEPTVRGEAYTALADGNLTDSALRNGILPIPEGSDGTFPSPADAPATLTRYLELPDAVPASITDAAAAVTEGASSRTDIGMALQDWFRGGDFTYDESFPYRPGDDRGNPYSVMESFLSERHGYCVHFATTFAVMARDLGVPTRVAVGYTGSSAPGEVSIVRGEDLHAWPEIYVDDVGWIAFEPTPGGAGVDADFAEGGTAEEIMAEPEVPEGQEEEEESAGTEEGGTEETQAPEEEEEVEESEAAGHSDPTVDADADDRMSIPWVPILVVFGALMVLALPYLVRHIRTRRRLSAIHAGTDPAQKAWAELEDTVADFGHGDGGPRARTAEARIESWAESGALTPEATEAAASVAAMMNAERYGGHPLSDSEATTLIPALDTVKRSLREQATAMIRVRALVLPRSLFPPGFRRDRK